MKRNDDLFTPEHVDEQIERLSQQDTRPVSSTEARRTRQEHTHPGNRLVRDLRRFYQSNTEEDARSLERAWGRITNSPGHVLPHLDRHEQPIDILRFRQERSDHMKNSVPDFRKMKGKTLQQWVGLIAAVLFLTFLIGSMAIVFNNAHQSKSQTASNSARNGTSTSITTITGTPTRITTPSGLYISSQTNWGIYQVSRVNLKSGAVLWNHNVGAIESSIVAANGIVYVTAGDPQSSDNYVYALNASDGSQLWRANLGSDNYTPQGNQGGPFNLGVLTTPTVVDGSVYVTARNGKMYALNAANGSTLWTYDSKAQAFTGGTLYEANPVAVVNGIVYGAIHNKMYAVNAKNGKEIWSISISSNFLFNAPQVLNNTIYISSFEESHHTNPQTQNSYVYAFATQNGSQLWSYHVGNWVLSPPVVANGLVYFGSYDDSLYALDAQSGKLRWNYNTGGHIYDSPIVSNGLVFVDEVGNANEGGNGASTVKPALLAIDAFKGIFAWRYEVDSTSSIAPQGVNKGILYSAVFGGYVYAFKAADGSLISRHKYGVTLIDKTQQPSDPAPQITVVP